MNSNPYFELIRTVWAHGVAWRRTIVGYYIAYIIAQGFLSLSPYAFGKTIDVLQHFVQGRLHELLFWLIFGVVLTPLFWLFHGPARVVERKVALKIQQAFIIDLYKNLTLLPLKWHQDHHSGNIITRMNRASTSLKRFAEDQFIYIETIMKFFVSIGFLCWISLPVGLLSLLSCTLAALNVILFDRCLIPLYESENQVENHVGAGLYDYIGNITTVLTLRLAELTERNLFRRLLGIWPFFNKEVVLNEVKWFAMGMLLSVSQSIILIGYILYSLKTMNGVLIGTVVMIFRYQWDLSEVFYNLSMHYSELVRMNTDVRSVKPMMDDIAQLAYPVPGSKIAQQWHQLTIENLSFAHAGGQHAIVNLNLKLHRGEKIALIGLSGAGKSTFLNVLSGLYTPDSARLVIDGVVFDTLEPMHAITTLIPQEPELFENTIGFNINMDLDTDSGVLEQVIALSCFEPVLQQLPLGLATDIREKGLNLSVGQKQRLAMARGLFAARLSSLVLMDEPTSSVDLMTEQKILSGVIASYPDATMIVSLHRLHLLPQFDRIIFMEHGCIVADGAAAELLYTDGPVKTLWEKYRG